jgi:virulence-associated protein VapD
MKWRDTESIMLLEAYDFVHYDEIEKPKHPHGLVCNVILDDVLSNKDAFSNKKGSWLNRAILNGRHYQLNVIVAAQHLKAITRCIRENTQLWALFPNKNLKTVIDDIYPLVSGRLTEEEFLKLYEYATDETHSALVIDEKDPAAPLLFKKNLDTILTINGNNEIEQKTK